MEETRNPLLEAEAIRSQPRVPIIEPVLPLLDEWSRDIITNACLIENDGKILVKYPDILLLASTGISHLEGLSKLTWEQGMSFLFDWEGFILDPLLDKYHRDPEAMRALRAIQSVMKRNIIGGSIGGAHQDFLVRYIGSDREIRLRRGEVGEEKR